MNAQNLPWLWAQSAGGVKGARTSGNYYSKSISVDRNSNVYMTGGFDTSISFNTVMLTNNSAGSYFIAKYNSVGSMRWAKTALCTGFAQGYSVSADANGHVYVVGSYQNAAISFDGFTLPTPAPGGINHFIVQYDTSGNVQWVKSIDAISTPAHLVAEKNGDVYVSAPFKNSITIGSTLVTGPDSNNIFIAKYNSSGSLQWAISAGGAGSGVGGLALDKKGNLLLTGAYVGQMSFGNGLPIINSVSPRADVFVAKYTPAGNATWATSIGGHRNEWTKDITTDTSGNIFIIGEYDSVFTAGTTVMLRPSGWNPSFTIKVNPTGIPVWGSYTQGVATEITSITCDAANHIWTSGDFSGYDLIVDGGLDTLFKSQGTGHATFLIKHDSAGALLSTIVLNATATLWPHIGFGHSSLAADPVNGLYIAGDFQDSVEIGGVTLNMPSSTNTNIFIAKFSDTCTVPTQMPASITGSNVVCDGNTYVYSITPAAGISYYSWSLPSGWIGGSSLTSQVMTTVNTNSGIVSVSAIGTCGVSAPQTLPVSVGPTPAPTITQSGLILSTAPGQGNYQWTWNGLDIPGATNDTYTVTQNASYNVQVTNSSGCSALSNLITIAGLGINDIDATGSFSLYPNPATTTLNVEYTQAGIIELTDMLGRITQTIKLPAHKNKHNVSIDQLPPGIYTWRHIVDGQDPISGKLTIIR